MSFFLPDLELEAILREGFAALRQDPTLITDLFGYLKQPYLYKKYGDKELNKLIKFFTTEEISIVHAFNLVQSSVPCISIQLIENPEEEAKDQLSDFENQITQPITDPNQLAQLVVVSGFTPTSYDPNTGILKIPDAVDLSNVRYNLLFVDASENEFVITGGINNLPGAKQFNIGKGQSPDLSNNGLIQSAINYEQYELQGVYEKERLILGIHTKEPLLTKYVYTVVKYTLNSRRSILEDRGMQLATYSGSDFTRDQNYGGDTVFSRFITCSVSVNNTWRSDKVVPIDEIDLNITVARDVASNEELGLQNQTVQVQDDDFQ